jgi:hypothetical protein
LAVRACFPPLSDRVPTSPRATNRDEYKKRRHADVRGAHPVPRGRGRRDRTALAKDPSSSWLNLVERFFAELSTRLLRRGVHRSVAELESDIRAWIAGWNDSPKPAIGAVFWHRPDVREVAQLCAQAAELRASSDLDWFLA